ncbi:MAG: hypothetical protein ABEJ89_10690 [Haloarculaceae archaeon]
MDRRVRLLALGVGVHLAAALAHGGVHGLLPVGLTDWQTATVVLALVAGPLAGLGVAVAGRLTAGASLVAASLVIALAFEALAHFVLVSPDNVGRVSAGHGVFIWTALLSLAGDAVGLGAALRVLHTEYCDRVPVRPHAGVRSRQE